MIWDVTVDIVSPLAASYVDRAATDADTVADMAASMKSEKYSPLSLQCTCSNQLQLRILARSVRQRWTSLLNWATEFVLSPVMSERVHTYSNAFLW